MRNNIRGKILILTLLTLLTSFYLVNTNITQNENFVHPDAGEIELPVNLPRDLAVPVSPVATLDYKENPIILISNDGDFTTKGFPGSGSEADPYVISGFNITDLSGTKKLIEVRDVESHFKIEGNYLDTGSTGIYIYNSANGTIYNNTIVNTAGYGIDINTLNQDHLVEDNYICNVSRGIYSRFSDNSIFTNNTIVNASSYGIYLDYGVGNKITDSSINASGTTDIYLYYADSTTIFNNTLYPSGKGIHSNRGENLNITLNRIIGGINAIYFFYGDTHTISSNTINDTSSTAIEINYSTGSEISWNNISLSEKALTSFSGIRALDFQNGLVSNNAVLNYYKGIDIGNNNPSNSNFTENRIDNSTYGIYAYPIKSDIIASNTILNASSVGLYIVSGQNSLIRNNTIVDTKIGIEMISATYGNQLLNNKIYNAGIDGVRFGNSIHNIDFVGNILVNSGTGIVMDSNNNLNISSNIIWDSAVYGIYLKQYLSTSLIFNNSIISNQGSGIYFTKISFDTEILNNTIENHVDYAFYMYPAYNNTVFSYNIVKNNGYGVYVDYRTSLAYSNEISFNNFIGNTVNIFVSEDETNVSYNYYDNWNSPNLDEDKYVDSAYALPGGVTSDLYPLINPVPHEYEADAPGVDMPPSISYGLASTNNFITWLVDDANPGLYRVQVDGLPFKELAYWSNGSLSVNVDGLPLGSHDVELILYDYYGNSNSDIVGVLVHESDIPGIKSPGDINYILFDEGNEISWTISDKNPASYNVTYKGGVIREIQPWSNTTVFIGVDGLDVGVHEYTINVYDIYGYRNSSTITVTVLMHELKAPDLEVVDYYEYDVASEEQHLLPWTVGDINPGTYRIYFEEEVPPRYENTWSNGTYELDVGWLSLGTYTYTIEASDSYGNIAEATITVFVFESIVPDLSFLNDTSYWKLSSGNSLNWQVSDLNPGLYNLSVDGKLTRENLSWSNGTIELDIDGLDLGSHTIVLTVSDNYGNSVIDEVIVTVLDDTLAPSISTSGDMTFTTGETGNNLTVTLSDLHPDQIKVTVDGELLFEGAWENGTLEFNFDELEVGEYLVVIEAKDQYGNSATSEVLITVEAVQTPSDGTTTPAENSITSDGFNSNEEDSPIGGVFLVLFSIVSVEILRKRRK